MLEKLFRVNWLLAHRHNTGARGPLADASKGQGRVLAILKECTNTSQAALAEKLGIRQQSLNELLVKLERKGLIERSPSKSDKRMQNVSLSQKGRLHEQQHNGAAEIFSGLTVEEKECMNACLDRIISRLHEKLGEGMDKDAYEWVVKSYSRCNMPRENLEMFGEAVGAEGFDEM
jgi:DNA-binding MarR family transcriptional regulator